MGSLGRTIRAFDNTWPTINDRESQGLAFNNAMQASPMWDMG